MSFTKFRLIRYEAESLELLARQMELSLPPGKHKYMTTISILNLEDTEVSERLKAKMAIFKEYK